MESPPTSEIQILEEVDASIAKPSNKCTNNKKKRPKFIRIVPCKVCGSDANDHLHYGSIVCYSCRAFFRRIVVNAKEPSTCQFNYGGQKCEVTPKTRSTCPYCRFHKCLEMGMQREWVMTEVDKEDRKKKNELIKKVGKKDRNMPLTNYESRMRAERKQLQRKKPSATETSVSSPPPEITLEDDTVDTTVFIVSNVGDNNSSCPTIESIDIDVLLEPEEASLIRKWNLDVPFGNEELGFLSQIFKLFTESAVSIPMNSSALMTVREVGSYKTKMPVDIIENIHTTVLERVIAFANNLHFFTGLTVQDQFSLLATNSKLVMNLLFHAFFDQRATLEDQILMLSSFWQDKRGIQTKPNETRVEVQLIHSFEASKMLSLQKMLDLILAMKMDYISLTLLVSLAFFDTSRVTGLEDLTQCQTIQKQLKRLLYRYLCARAGNTQAIETVPHYEHFMATLQNMEDIGMPQSTLNLSDIL